MTYLESCEYANSKKIVNAAADVKGASPSLHVTGTGQRLYHGPLSKCQMSKWDL